MLNLCGARSKNYWRLHLLFWSREEKGEKKRDLQNTLPKDSKEKKHFTWLLSVNGSFYIRA